MRFLLVVRLLKRFISLITLICDLKNDFALGKIISKDFSVTQSATWVSALSCVIMPIFRNIDKA